MGTRLSREWILRTVFCVLCLMLTVAGTSQRAAADMITTTFASNNGQAGNMFDLNVLVPGGVMVHGFDLNLLAGDWDIEVYFRSGTYAGSETTVGDWTLHETITGLTSAGVNTPTSWDFNDLMLAAGGTAFYVNVTNGAGLRYTNGSTEGNLFVTDGQIEIFEGTGNGANFGGQFRPRVWNGTIHYTAIPEPASAIALAVGLFALAYRRRSQGQGLML